jgi:hypothetical protein
MAGENPTTRTNRQKRDEMTAHKLRELLDYDPDTGAFHWRVDRKGGNGQRGQIAGSPSSTGYWQIGVNGGRFLAHRLAWLYVHGELPLNQIDHIDGIKSNNRMSNLRDITLAHNVQNQHQPARDNKTGFLGVSLHRRSGKFRAVITVARRQLWIGQFDSPEQAHAAYLEAKRKHHTGCTL